MSKKRLKITLIKSAIGYSVQQKRTVRALGLRKMNHSVIHDPTPTIQGMIKKVEHLVNVEEVDNDETA